MNCKWDNLRCIRCGATARSPAARRNCDAAPRPGLGDHLERVLSAVGVTKERADAVAVAVGWDGCGCEERKEFLNDAGLRIGIGH
jgi:hypothetical protein